MQKYITVLSSFTTYPCWLNHSIYIGCLCNPLGFPIPWHQTTVIHSKIYPLVNVYKKRWEITMFHEKINYLTMAIFNVANC